MYNKLEMNLSLSSAFEIKAAINECQGGYKFKNSEEAEFTLMELMDEIFDTGSLMKNQSEFETIVKYVKYELQQINYLNIFRLREAIINEVLCIGFVLENQIEKTLFIAGFDSWNMKSFFDLVLKFCRVNNIISVKIAPLQQKFQDNELRVFIDSINELLC
jgi:hypothetical protein